MKGDNFNKEKHANLYFYDLWQVFCLSYDDLKEGIGQVTSDIFF
jgi:hypothetical protein